MIKTITLTCTVTRQDFSFKQIYHYLEQIELKYLKNQKLSAAAKQTLSDKVLDVLDIVGEMSLPIFNKRDEIERKWMVGCTNREAARDSWLKEYSQLHKPYDKLKDRAYDIFCQINGIDPDAPLPDINESYERPEYDDEDDIKNNNESNFY
jgi:hypothetical protein